MTKQELLKHYYGYDAFKEEQLNIINSVFEKRYTMGILPTGYGKSVCFQIPALMLEGVTIVITPLISLMEDQVKSLKSRFIHAEFINSTLDLDQQNVIYDKLKNNKIKILYVSAERLSTLRFKNEIKNINISLIVIDEAHTLCWSESFRFEMRRINEFINDFSSSRVLALTATATSDTISKINQILGLDNPNIIMAPCVRDNIFYGIENTKNKLNFIYKYINNNKDKKGIIYTLTVRNAEYIYEYLINMGFNAGIYHGKMDTKYKQIIQNKFKYNDIKILICTNAFGMGIDVPDIRYIINYDLPASIEDYAQQTGRASRDNKYAEAILLFDTRDIKTVEYFIDNIDNSYVNKKDLDKIKSNNYKKLDSMITLALSNKCIHKSISNYFGYKYEKKCTMCSKCVKKRW